MMMTAIATGASPHMFDTLARASAWMFVSMALQPPTTSSRERLEALLPSLPPPLQPIAARFTACPLEEWEPEFFSVLGPAGCPACESSYERAAQASRGPILADVSGCYRAFAFTPDVREVPDHACVEAGFLGYLAVKVAFADHAGDAESARVAQEAYDMFLEQHVAAWFGDFAEALIACGSAPATVVAELLDAMRAI
jgi:nitrate reductase assembly molybdenum cofactor insertion protein NarJ